MAEFEGQGKEGWPRGWGVTKGLVWLSQRWKMDHFFLRREKLCPQNYRLCFPLVLFSPMAPSQSELYLIGLIHSVEYVATEIECHTRDLLMFNKFNVLLRLI